MSVKKRDDTGKWEARWRDATGRNRSRSFTRHRDAINFDDRMRRLKALGPVADPDRGRQTLNEHVEEWWRHHATRNLEQNTLNTYAAVWGKHIRPELGDRELRELSPLLIDRWTTNLATRGVGASVIAKSLATLHAILGLAVTWGHIDSNPARGVRKPRAPRKRTVKPLDPEVIEALRHAIAAPRAPEGDTGAALVSLLAYAGLRPEEALALLWVDVRDRTLLVDKAVTFGTQKATKTSRTRTVPMVRQLVSDLAELRMAQGRPSDAAHVVPRTDGSAWRDHDWRNWRRRHYQPAAKTVGASLVPYDLRHSFVSLLVAEGLSVVEVARRAGHSPVTCLGTYAHVFDEAGGGVSMEDAIRDARAEIAGSRRDERRGTLG